ncbi:MAG: glycoside hydrolase family 3 protein [Oscillospiraceae bacterium]|jgi:beta-glucosidase|nr:glycoside hydrolase family 3 protein [Oscillospiraceae bacterium]
MAQYTTQEKDGYIIVENANGAALSLSDSNSIPLIEQDGYAFKDLNKNGVLDPYEDWRLPVEDRVADLVGKMTDDDILGLMLHGMAQVVVKITPERLANNPMLQFIINRSPQKPNADLTQPTDDQRDLILNHHMRFWLLSAVESAEIAARLQNNIQAVAESTALGIPASFSTNPRNTADTHNDSYGESKISLWPGTLGLAATFDPKIAYAFGRIAGREYRALGIGIDLGPQIDPGTDPRWNRFGGTFGEDLTLSADMARAVCDGHQTSDNPIADGWGKDSILAMAKHWPGSMGESGRESHSWYGKYNVYPGGNLMGRIRPWSEGAFKLDGPTGQAASIMTCYDVIWGEDKENNENNGASFNHFIASTLLREICGFEGIACTDFGVTADIGSNWGMEHNTAAERVTKLIEANIDWFGGLGDVEVVRGGYAIGVAKHGAQWMRKQIEASATRILTYLFKLGLFEDPYLDPLASEALVGCDAFMQKGFEAQLKSVVLLKNKGNILPLKGRKVYIADKGYGGVPLRTGEIPPVQYRKPIDMDKAAEYFEIAQTPKGADCAIVYMDGPHSGSGYNTEQKEFVPISLQYNDYTADYARVKSIASGHTGIDCDNWSYQGKSCRTYNKYDLDTLIRVKKEMGDKPVIVVLQLSNPVVPAEFEPFADAIVTTFSGVTSDAVLMTLTGRNEPSALLPFQMPKDMLTVEMQLEDIGRDMLCYTDACGNTYDFAFGMNWSGVIEDDRVEKYR